MELLVDGLYLLALVIIQPSATRNFGTTGINAFLALAFDALAFAFFRVAALCQSVYARALAGNAADADAVNFDGLARLLAETGLGIAEGAEPADPA